jgi:hypothetical protein
LRPDQVGYHVLAHLKADRRARGVGRARSPQRLSLINAAALRRTNVEGRQRRNSESPQGGACGRKGILACSREDALLAYGTTSRTARRT